MNDKYCQSKVFNVENLLIRITYNKLKKLEMTRTKIQVL